MAVSAHKVWDSSFVVTLMTLVAILFFTANRYFTAKEQVNIHVATEVPTTADIEVDV